jgi:hypothetical protein
MVQQRYKIEVTGAAGGAGVATATANSDEAIYGWITAVHLEYVGTPPATTDVVIVEAFNDPPQPVLTASNQATDKWFNPLAQAQGVDGVDISPGVPIIVADIIKATISGADNDDGVTVTLVVER